MLVAVVATVQTVLLLAVGVLFYGLDLPTDGQPLADLRLGQRARHHRLHAAAASRSPRRQNGRSAPAVISPIVIVLQFISGVFFVYADAAALDAARSPRSSR